MEFCLTASCTSITFYLQLLSNPRKTSSWLWDPDYDKNMNVSSHQKSADNSLQPRKGFRVFSSSPLPLFQLKIELSEEDFPLEKYSKGIFVAL